MTYPVIGVPMDYQESGGYSSFPWCVLRENYLSIVSGAKGFPVALFHDKSLVDNFLDMIDGLMITGAGFDIDPALYGETNVHSTVTVNPKRTSFEWLMIQGALKRGMPILGVCGGAQLINVVLGGTLIQHIPDVSNKVEHFSQSITADLPCHLVDIAPESRLFNIVNKSQMHVNSRHHQAVKVTGKNVVVNARSQDGLIEGIELVDYPFCIGVQWHPEFCVDNQDENIIVAFVQAALLNRMKK